MNEKFNNYNYFAAKPWDDRIRITKGCPPALRASVYIYAALIIIATARL